jgi:hypothetical protein
VTAGAGSVTAGSSGDALAGFATCGKTPKDGMCKAKAPGVYALKTEVDVWWRDTNNSMPLFDPGRGKITVYFRGELSDVCEDGTGGKAMMHPCGTRLPPLFAEANCGIIQIVFPDTLWDAKDIPSYSTTGSTSGFGVGDILTIDKTPGLLGIDLADVNGAFPDYKQTTTFACTGGAVGDKCFPDADSDGKPGITVQIQKDGALPTPTYPCAGAETLGKDWHYIPAPFSVLDGLTGTGADTVYIGLRTRLGGSGMIGADCASGAGVATADGFESRTLDCVGSDGTACTPDQSTFIDENNPNYNVLQVGGTPPADWKHPTPAADAKLDRSPSKGPLSSVVRLGDLGQTFTCDQVRMAAFPPNQ